MRNATEYLGRVKALILVNPSIVHWETVREEAEGDMGLFRYRLRLHDDSLLEVLERFEVAEGDVNVTKYCSNGRTALAGCVCGGTTLRITQSFRHTLTTFTWPPTHR